MSRALLGLGRFVNRLLRPAGLKIQPYDPNAPVKRKVYWDRYENVLGEFHNHLIETALPDLPRVEGRIELLGRLEGQSIREAMWILQALHQSLGVDGDICEFGCAAGATSALIANEIRNTNKSLWLFDSFQGLPKPTEKDQLLNDFWNLGSIKAYAGTMSYPIESVQRKLKDVDFPLARIEVVPGFIEETLRLGHAPNRVSFALVDVDFYSPVLTALFFLRERIAPGGRIIVDDYGSFSAGAKAAVDEFAAKYPNEFLVEFSPAWSGQFAVFTKMLR